MAVVPGIGAPAAEAAEIVSGIGDVLHFFSRCLERLGLERAEQVDLLDVLIAMLEHEGATQRAIVPKALRAVLLPDHKADDPTTPPFRVIAGGRQGRAPNAGPKS